MNSEDAPLTTPEFSTLSPEDEATVALICRLVVTDARGETIVPLLSQALDEITDPFAKGHYAGVLIRALLDTLKSVLESHPQSDYILRNLQTRADFHDIATRNDFSTDA